MLIIVPPCVQPPYIFADYTAFYGGIGTVASVALLFIIFNIFIGCKYK